MKWHCGGIFDLEPSLTMQEMQRYIQHGRYYRIRAKNKQTNKQKEDKKARQGWYRDKCSDG